MTPSFRATNVGNAATVTLAVLAALAVSLPVSLPLSLRVPGGAIQAPSSLCRADDSIAPPSLRPPVVSERVEAAIEKGMKFLAAAQTTDGSLGASRFNDQLYPTVMSAMAGLTFMANGSTITRGPYARNIRRITDYLLEHCVSSEGVLMNDLAYERRPMYGHAFAMAFLAHVYGQEPDAERRERIEKVLKRAIKLTLDVQSVYGGWGYEPDDRKDEGTLTVTQTQALRACRDAGFNVPKGAIDRAVAYIEESTNPDGSVRYRTTSVRSHTRPGVACAAIVTLWSAGRYEDPLLQRISNYVDRMITPRWASLDYTWYEEHHAEYVLYYLGQAKYFLGGPEWPRFYRTISEKLVSEQQVDGSWRGSDSGRYGELYTTSMALLILQLPYNRLPLYQR